MNRPNTSFAASILFCFVTMLFSLRVNSQAVPSFKITLSNNKVFNAADLPKGKPVVLIYFDPDCDHCQKLMTELFKKINNFKINEFLLSNFKKINR